jgi:hypothetical protein
VCFFELAFVDLDVRRQQRQACVVLNDFIIPSEDLIPVHVREQISSWSDLIDYWSVDFDYSDETFHNQWQAYRTREKPKLATQSDWHEYPEARTSPSAASPTTSPARSPTGGTWPTAPSPTWKPPGCGYG